GERRGAAGDRFHPERAARLTLGFAASHRAAPGDHTAWVAGLGSAADPFPDAEAQAEPPVLEGLSPAYQLYPLRNVDHLLLGEANSPPLQPPREGVSPLPRYSEIGYSPARAGRLAPLLLACYRGGWVRGCLAWMVVRARP